MVTQITVASPTSTKGAPPPPPVIETATATSNSGGMVTQATSTSLPPVETMTTTSNSGGIVTQATPTFPPPSEMTTATSNSSGVVTQVMSTSPPAETNNYDYLPASLHLFLPHTAHEFTGGEAQFKATLLAVTQPLGIFQVSIKNIASASNKNVKTKEKFPHRRLRYYCRSCDKAQKQMDDSQQGCCGFWIGILLVDRNEDKEPHLRVTGFNLPPTSNHVLVSEEARAKSASKVIVNEDQLTPTKTKFLKSMGKNRLPSHTVQNMMQDQFNGLHVDKNLANRVMRKGRNEAWGSDDEESMVIFYSEGLKMLQEDSNLGVAGKFKTITDPSNGVLVAWLEQTPLEVANARVYGKDAVWVDTTHNATRFNLKTGPLSVADWSGLTAPAGFYMVREEETELCARMQAQLELNAIGATCATDGGSAWPGIVRAFGQSHIEDTFHNDKSGELKAAQLPKKAKSKFNDLKYSVLYLVHTPEDLTKKFAEMRTLVGQCDGEYIEVMRWIDRMEEGQYHRAATHTTKHFCCSLKGAASRCEVSMSRLKAAGKAKSEMRKWSLPEIQHRHNNIVKDYETDAKKEIVAAIKEKRFLSNYVLEKELEELKHVGSLEVVEVKENTPNPFHGVLQSSKKSILINLERPPNASLGITLVYKRVVEVEDPDREELGSLQVTAIAPDSPCKGTQLQVGMLIRKINGETFASAEDGIELIKAVEGHFTISADTIPMMGTTYIICRKKDKKMDRTVFIPDSANGLAAHCQSDYHCHTAFWIRCRYIQRALLQHPSRSMEDLSTIHSRWHIQNSPLYRIVHNDLATTMKIDGLGNASLPAFLTEASHPAASVNEDNDSTEETVPRFRKPTTKAVRYNNANRVVGRIVEIAKEDAGVYEMVMPQLHHIYQNCLIMRKSSSSKASSSKEAVTAAKASLPLVPESVRTDKSDDTNLANRKSKKKTKRKISDGGKRQKKAMKAKSCSSTHDDDSDDDDNTPLSALRKD